MKCLVNEGDFQVYPETGELADNSNLSLNSLVKLLPGLDDARVYSYVVRTIKRQGSGFVQSGSGPNFQGGRITLCTCKHRMRTYLDADSWRGVWVAGFSGVNVTDRENGLVYLMQVDWAFESHCELWQWLPAKVRRAKAAHLHKLGDVFKPKTDCIRPDGPTRFEPANYVPPRPDHSHASSDDWYRDVSYEGCGGRRAALLVGDPERSFLWSTPIVFFGGSQHPRTRKWKNLQEFLNHLTG